MAGVITVAQFAESIAVPVDKLIQQLQQAGIAVRGAESEITEAEKRELLAFLKRDHGAAEQEAPKKITLKRQRVSEIKVQGPLGKKTTVSVVSKRRHVYVKKDALPEAQQNNELLQETVLEVPAEAPVEAIAVEKVTPEVLSTPAQDTPEASKEAPKVEASTKPPVKEKEKEKDRKTLQREEDERKNKSKHKAGAGRAAVESVESKDWRHLKGAAASLVLGNEEGEDLLGGSLRKRRSGKARHKKDAPDIKRHAFEKPVLPVKKDILVPEAISVSDLAQKMSVKAAEIVKALFKLGIMATINQVIDQDTAIIVAQEMGHTAMPLKDLSVEDSIAVEHEGEAVQRAPVVTVMGHVDHGKTSLLDAVRRTRVTDGEAGGITQHIGAYHVNTSRGSITFLDTPGHAAFTAMRARGAQCTDIVILVVAADDGVMPQTIEAIQHAKAASVPIVVAVNKMDKPDANIENIYNQLSTHHLVPEAWGGDTIFVPVSAKTGEGVEALLESVSLQAEMLELKAAADGPAKGRVIEARLDKGRGSVATLLVQAGCLRLGDVVLAGSDYGRVRGLFDDTGRAIKMAGPSTPVEILGLSGVPQAGEAFVAVVDERKARTVALFRQNKERDIKFAKQSASGLEGLFDRIQQGELKNLNVVLKADVQGSVEALGEALEALSTEEIKVKVITRGVGGITESDMTLALASEAIVIGFNVRADAVARRLSEKEGIKLYYHSIIYDVVDQVKAAITGMTAPVFQEKITGLAEVRDVFRSPKLGAIAGCMVLEGVVKRGAKIRVLRDNTVIYQGELESLRRFKDDAQEVRNGMECGIGVKQYNDVKIGDQIETYEMVEVKANA